ncbi:ABC transporter substrate-binding protein [Aureimonas flava]|uniref:ABC transporter substrate-binding protein n=1 Tax=Aureimonas flava TaxID=2320271 RepID=A0A3A1WEV5_9HYPH|nr:ABC transporter substrate-binding protein [Aureimonas flava]RIX97989.1 ABC transporter substrate-binding protein [Aureimonas flava]
MKGWWTTLTIAAGLLLAAPAHAQTPPGVLVVGQIAEPQSLDPQQATAANDFRVTTNVLEGLVRYRSGTLDLEPALATGWQISPDGLTYRFALRQGVRFHDGTPFDAAAVKFTFDRMLDEAHPFHDTGTFPLAFQFSKVQETRVVDPATVEFRLSEPYAPFLANLALPVGAIVSPAAVAAAGEDFGRRPVGTGPFRFEEWVANQRVVLSANPSYWDGAPALRTVVFRPVSDPTTRVAEMLSGGIDVMVETPPDNVVLFRDNLDFTLHETVGPHEWFLILNTRDGIFADKRVRQAVNLAVDKKTLVEDVLQGTATIAAGAIPPAFEWAYDPGVAPWPHDPERARALLREAGAEGAGLRFLVTEGGSGMLDPVPMATAIQADLKAVGLDVAIETYEWNAYLARVNAGLEGQGDMAQMAWMTNDPDTLPSLTLHSDALPEAGGFNSGYYANPELDALLDRARTLTDEAERGAIYREVQALVHEEAPWLFGAHWRQNAVTAKGVSGFVLQPDFTLQLRSVVKS